MASRATLLAVVLAVPLLAFVVAHSLTLRHEREFQAALAREYPALSAAQRAALSLRRICADPRGRLAIREGVCRWHGLVGAMRAGAVATAAAGLGWLGVIALAGRLARGNRMLLLRVFRPGLYLTNALLVVLIALHGVLAMAAVYLGEAALIGRVHPFVIVAIGIGALVGVVGIARVSFAIVRPAVIDVVGRTVPRERAAELWALVDEVAGRAGVAPPDRIVAGLEPNFFVTEAHVRCLDGERPGRTLFVSLSLAHLFTRDELRSVIGHELGHFKGQDTEWSRRFYPIYRGTLEALETLGRSGGGSLSASVALIPAAGILGFFLESFAVAESAISRARELAADAVGANVAGSRATASALVKVHAHARHWPAVRFEMGRAAAERRPPVNPCTLLVQAAAEHARPEALADLDQARSSHPTDSHPPLGDRLRGLGVPLREVEAAALDVRPAGAAIDLVPEHERLEEDLGAVEHQRLIAALAGAGIRVVPAPAAPRPDAPPAPSRPAPAPASPAAPAAPAAPAGIICWFCKGPLEVTPATRGKTVKCPRCGVSQALPP